MPSFDTVTMAERKRPALDEAHNSAPPLKRQAVTINGTSSGFPDDLPGKEDLDRYQKDAIFRQMREYKREAATLESQLNTLKERALHHDEHLRVMDAWFAQLLDEVALMSHSTPPSQIPFESSLLSSAPDVFSEHLAKRSGDIKTAVTTIFSKASDATPEIRQLQQRLSKLLAAEKAHAVELQKVLSEKERMSDLLESASYRYMVAEKKLDRAKSAQVAKLEASAMGNVKTESDTDADADAKPVKQTNGAVEDVATVNAAETARKEAEALANKRAEQLDQLVQDNKRLIEQVTSAQMKAGLLTDEEVAKSEVFKMLRTQYEEVVKRVNDLEGTNIKLRDETKQLQAERTLYREEADTECRNAMIENESQLARAETDLARIRHARDELVADLQKAKVQLEHENVSRNQARDLQESQASRILALEAEVERLRQEETELSADVAALTLEELQTRVRSIERDKSILTGELRSMEAAWKKAQAAGSKKYLETVDAEDKVNRLSAEKAKADQKYFGAMKAKELRDQEVRTLKATNAKSAEIISQLKDAEGSCRGLLQNLEKQLADAKDSINVVTSQQRLAQQGLTEQKLLNEKLTLQVETLKKSMTAKDLASTSAADARREAEIQAERLKIMHEESNKSVETWRKKAQGNQSEEVEMLRTIALCNVCRKNFKNTAIKTCGHVLCSECVDTRLRERSRKCPNCGMPFGREDPIRVTL